MPCIEFTVAEAPPEKPPEKPTEKPELPTLDEVWKWLMGETYGIPNWLIVGGAVVAIGAFMAEEERRRQMLLLAARR